MANDDLEIAKTDASKRTEQYMTVKKWIIKTQKTLIVQGIKLEEKAETPVVMITTDNHNSKRVQNSDRGPYKGNKGNRRHQQDGRNGGSQSQSDRRTITDCGFCNLIREKDVSQEYVQREFDEMHQRLPDRAIWPNQCLPWIMLSIDDRIKIIQDSNVFCRFCLKFLGIGATSNSCG